MTLYAKRAMVELFYIPHFNVFERTFCSLHLTYGINSASYNMTSNQMGGLETPGTRVARLDEAAAI